MITFDLPTEEALLLRDTAERFVADHYTLPQRAAMVQAAADQTPMHWAAMAELGWLAAPLPEAVGGLGLGPAQAVPLLEVLGAGLVLEPVVPVAMHCAATIARALPAAEAEAVLAPVLSGARIEVMAEGNTGAPITATRDGDRLSLSGTAPMVPGGAAASAFWCVADLSGARVLVRIAAEAAAVTPFRLLDGQAAARVCFDGVSCAAEAAVFDCGAALAFGAAMGLLGNLAETCGLIDGLFQATLDYVKMREQFGRPIGRFQSVQHRMADMFIAREEAQSMLRLAAEAVESGDAGFRTRLVSAARVKIGDHARKVLRDAVQLHGGMGVTDEVAVGHMVKRLLVLTQMGGSRGAHLKRFRDAA